MASATVIIPANLALACSRNPESSAWLAQVPLIVCELQERWSLSISAPFDTHEGSCAWVAPAVRQNGSQAVLKVGMPHMEAEHEIQALQLLDGNPTAFLLESDQQLNALLLERCLPGSSLRELPEPEQDAVIAGLLRRFWRRVSPPHPFRPLAEMTAHWASETIADAARWTDAGLVQAGLQLFEELSRPAASDVLLATDLHAGNVLRAQREPWLVIDPKPFIGDPAYDATQHLFNCRDRLRADPHGTIGRFADLLEIDQQRIRLWTFARAACESRESWDDDSLELARLLA